MSTDRPDQEALMLEGGEVARVFVGVKSVQKAVCSNSRSFQRKSFNDRSKHRVAGGCAENVAVVKWSSIFLSFLITTSISIENLGMRKK